MTPLHHLLVDVLRLALWLAVLCVVFVPLERLFALKATQLWRAGTLADIGFYFLSSLLPAALLVPLMALLATALQAAVPASWLGWAAGLPTWLRFALALLVAEAGTYWGHRLAHEVPFLWRFHSVHHTAEHMDWLVNTRDHPFDLVFVRLCGLVPLYVTGLAQPSTAGGSQLATIATFAVTFWGFLIHANVAWRFGWLEQLLATPAFHHWHHSRNDHINRNYATMFPWMDRLFGTLYLPHEWPTAYGIEPRPTTMRQAPAQSQA